MSAYELLAAFGGGLFGGLIGGVNAFIFTGITALCGIAVLLSTGSTAVLDNIAFGPFFAPNIAFVGGVAAVAYAGRKMRKAKAAGEKGYDIDVQGNNITLPMFGTMDPSVLLVGGIFGVMGYVINYVFVNYVPFSFDTAAFAVLICCVISRLVFGETGILGKYPEGEKRYSDMTGKFILYTILWGFAIGALNGFVCIKLNVPFVGFAISAASLIFLYIGKPFTSTHHVTMVSGYAALAFANPVLAGVFGAIAALTGEYLQRTTNTHVDSHIDREATTIFIWSLIILTFLS
ncbi:hypothetical protein EII17_09355 [Clostridiales bacterium COT073_COT-073]|nr:hypothetical protein EII17_09355 [Clostridiales bacterium COT073_COT-073]